MKNLILVLAAMALLVSCATTDGTVKQFTITDEASTQAIAYGAGKGMGIAVNKIVPVVDADLGVAWKSLMERNAGKDVITSSEMILFYNECIGIIALHTEDEYGIISDLGVFLMIFGAQFDQSGNLILIQPVPMKVMQFFEMGYRNGKMVALRG